MEKIIHKLISEFTKGIDTHTHNGSTWLIFTESKQWVIELTDNKTLWYNYNFFKSVFAYASLDCVQNQHLITKWVEDNIINKVSDIRFRDARDNKHQFEDTLENGVKETRLEVNITEGEVDDIIQDGVKEIYEYKGFRGDVKDVIQDGVRDTQYSEYENQSWVKGVIKKGVKETKSDDFNVSQFLCEEVIDKGVKETKYHMSKLRVNAYKAVDNGVKETNHVDVMKFFNNKMEDTLKNGIKSSTPRQYVGENIIDKIIDKGVIETHREICEYKHTVEHIIQTGVKETKISPTSSEYGDWLDGDEKLDEIIKNGVKETKYNQSHQEPKFKEVLKNGVKRTFDCNWPVPTDLIEGVINDGVKDTKVCNYTDPKTQLITIKWGHCIDEVIENGEKISGTFVGGNRQKENVESVIGYGTKNPTG